MKVVLIFLFLLAELPPYAIKVQRHIPPHACAAVQDAYASLRQQDTQRTEQAFLQAFPSTYATFTAIFGYSGRDGRTTSILSGCLYETSEPYIERLFTLRQVPRAAVFAKLLGIARHAQWQSDGLTMLQQHCIDLATTDAAFLAFLNEQPVAEIRSFTRFIQLNPVSNEPLRKQIKAAYAKYSHLQSVVR